MNNSKTTKSSIQSHVCIKCIGIGLTNVIKCLICWAYLYIGLINSIKCIKFFLHAYIGLENLIKCIMCYISTNGLGLINLIKCIMCYISTNGLGLINLIIIIIIIMIYCQQYLIIKNLQSKINIISVTKGIERSLSLSSNHNGLKVPFLTNTKLYNQIL